MGEAKHNAIKDLPKSFHKTKREFEKDCLRYFAKKDRGDKTIQGEFYVLLKEVQTFIDNAVLEQEQCLVDEFEILEKPIYLNDYKKKIIFDRDASWIYIDKMTSTDFRRMVNGEDGYEDSRQLNFDFGD